MKLSTFAKELEKKGFTVNCIAHPEDTGPADHFIEEEDINYIIEQLENGNNAAWFLAEVSLEFEGLLSESEYLGGCSYESFDEFTGTDDDYFDDMLRICLSDIQAKAEKIINSFPLIAI